jgi:hypothetical protein
MSETRSETSPILIAAVKRPVLRLRSLSAGWLLLAWLLSACSTAATPAAAPSTQAPSALPAAAATVVPTTAVLLTPTPPPTLTPTPSPAPTQTRTVTLAPSLTSTPSPVSLQGYPPIVTWYDFEDDFVAAGTVTDRSSVRLDAQIVGKVEKTAGLNGSQAIFFPFGGDAYLQAKLNPAARLNTFAISFWFKTSDPQINWLFASAARWNGKAGDSGWALAARPPGLWGDDGKSILLAPRALNQAKLPDGWVHVVFEYGPIVDEKIMRVYVNTSMFNQWPTTGVALGQGLPMVIGGWPDAQRWYAGALDDFMVFAGALNPDQVRALYRRGRPPTATPGANESPTPAPTETATAPSPTPPEPCPSAPPFTLQIGQSVVVNPDAEAPSRLRAAPGLLEKLLAELAPGTRLVVLDGPRCGGGFAWWRVTTGALTGWTVEGDLTGGYRLATLTPTPTVGPTPTPGPTLTVQPGYDAAIFKAFDYNIEMIFDSARFKYAQRPWKSNNQLAVDTLVHLTRPDCALSSVPGFGPPMPALFYVRLLGGTRWTVEVFDQGQALYSSHVLGHTFQLTGLGDEACRADLEEVLAGAMPATVFNGAPTLTPIPTRTPAPLDFQCDSLAPRLRPGSGAYVTAPAGLTLWDQPEQNALQTYPQYGGYWVSVSPNTVPVCVNGQTFWQVEVGEMAEGGASQAGWMAECNAQEYFLEEIYP